MIYCGKCGAQMEDTANVCPNCGEPVAAPQQQMPPQGNQKDDLGSKLAALNDTADTTGDFDPADIEQNKVMAILAYLGWLVLIPIFAAPNSKFARYHANQGLVLAIAEIGWSVVTGILKAILGLISAQLASVVGFVLGIANLVFLVGTVLGIVNAANGKAKELPIIGKFKILK